MTDAIIHRGPDSDGHWQDDHVGVALGMRRLAIIDLSPAGLQPMTSADGRYVMVFNGEVYNFHEIRNELERTAKAPTWRGHSDTEVLLAAIAAWGIEPALKAANAMFALAIWDRQDRKLHLAIDRFGEKPLYYGWMGASFLFGSELKALMAHPDWAPEIDQRALATYLRFSYVPAPYCIFRGINKLEPGTLATFSLTGTQTGSRKITTSTYWSVREAVIAAKASPLDIFGADAVDEFENVLSRSVKLRMESDVPLGAFLSGGFDSSAVVALMQSQSQKPVNTFSIGFAERGYNEAPFAAAVAKHLGTNHTELYVSSQQAMDVIPHLPAIYDEPFADSSQIPTFLVAQMTRKHVTVALSGDAGDELFGGYARYFVSNRTMPTIASLPLGLRQLTASGIRSVGADGWNGLYRLVTLGRGKGIIGDRALKFADLLSLASPSEGYRSLVSSWKDPGRVAGADELQSVLDRWQDVPAGLSFVEQMMFLDTISYLPGDILTKVDRATMATSLEGRVPFLDPDVLEFAWRLPLTEKIRGGTGKWILRQLVYRHVPAELMDRPKAGFGIPLKDWIRGPLRDWAESLLEPSALAALGLDPTPITSLWQEHQSGSRNWQHMIWPVLMLLAWNRA